MPPPLPPRPVPTAYMVKDRVGDIYEWKAQSVSGEVRARDIRAAFHAVVDQLFRVPYPPEDTLRDDILIKRIKQTMPKTKRFEIHQDGMTIEGDNL